MRDSDPFDEQKERSEVAERTNVSERQTSINRKRTITTESCYPLHESEPRLERAISIT